MSVIPIDKYDRDYLRQTLDALKEEIENGEVTGFAFVAISKAGDIYSHNAELNDFPRLIGLLEIKKLELMKRY